MPKDIRTYFEQTIIPLITEKYPKVASEMSIQVIGSYGLGIADELSDMEADIFLDDPLWKSHGGQIQLILENCSHRFAKPTDHTEICVNPLSKLLHGHYKEFLEDKADLPWEKIAIDALFELQESLVLRDPHNIFQRLRKATVPKRFPDWLWRKLLLLGFKKLIIDNMGELKSTVQRGRMIEAQVVLGCVLEDLMRLGFIIDKHYYPWRTHLRWGFEKLPGLASRLLSDIEVAASSPDWNKKLASIETIIIAYKEHIAKDNLLPEINILTPDLVQELVWAERCKAWSNPNWRDWLTKCQRKAKEAGENPNNFWIWSLWGWK